MNSNDFLGEFATHTCFQGRFGEEIGSDQFGSQIMFHQQELNAGEVVGHIEHIEITYAGQAFRLGRYPIHFHINGDMNGSYVRGCGIHHTFNRAVNIHHTDNILVENNVVYDVMGGAIFLEDSIEVGNIFQYNLAIFVRSSSSLLNDDITPAGFWITHPDNIVRHNHVAGGTHFGFWYRMLEHPQGPSFTEDIWPQNVPLGEFYNNTVHSVGWYGLWVFEFYTPKVDGGKSKYGVPIPAVFKNLTTWNSFRGAEWVEAYPMQFHGFVLANNFMAGTEHYFNRGTAPQYSQDGAMVKDTVIIGHLNSANHPPCTKRGIVLPLDGGVLFDGITFVNFDGEKNENHTCSAIGTVKIVCICELLCAGYNYKFKNIKWLNSNKKAYWEWEHQAELEDLDGTLTGHGAGARAMSKSNLFPPECFDDDEWSPNFGGMICPGNESVDVIRMSFNYAKPESLMFKDLSVQNQYGTSKTKFRSKGNTFPSGWMLLLISKLPHNISFINMDHITNISYNGAFYGLEVGI